MKQNISIIMFAKVENVTAKFEPESPQGSVLNGSRSPTIYLLLNAFLESVATNNLFKKTALMAMLIQSDYYCTAATMLIITLRNMLCFAFLRRRCKYNDICNDVKYAFISFYISIMFYSFNYYRCTICIGLCFTPLHLYIVLHFILRHRSL